MFAESLRRRRNFFKQMQGKQETGMAHAFMRQTQTRRLRIVDFGKEKIGSGKTTI